MQIAVTEQGSSIDEQNRDTRAMAPVETVEQWLKRNIKDHRRQETLKV